MYKVLSRLYKFYLEELTFFTTVFSTLKLFTCLHFRCYVTIEMESPYGLLLLPNLMLFLTVIVVLKEDLNSRYFKHQGMNNCNVFTGPLNWKITGHYNSTPPITLDTVKLKHLHKTRID